MQGIDTQDTPAREQRGTAMSEDEIHVARWMRHLAAELSCAQGQGVPLEALLARWVGRVQPQHMFDGLRRLLQGGEAGLELGPGGYLLALAAQGEYTPRGVTSGEMVVLAAAVGAVQGRRVYPIRSQNRRR